MAKGAKKLQIEFFICLSLLLWLVSLSIEVENIVPLIVVLFLGALKNMVQIYLFLPNNCVWKFIIIRIEFIICLGTRDSVTVTKTAPKGALTLLSGWEKANQNCFPEIFGSSLSDSDCQIRNCNFYPWLWCVSLLPGCGWAISQGGSLPSPTTFFSTIQSLPRHFSLLYILDNHFEQNVFWPTFKNI